MPFEKAINILETMSEEENWIHLLVAAFKREPDLEGIKGVAL